MLSREDITAHLLRERLALIAFLASVTRDFHLAEDVFQDVCVKAIGHEPGFESVGHLVNWARLTGRNRAIDLLRVRDGKYEGLSEELLDSLAAAWPDEAVEVQRRKQAALERCLERLTPNNREIVRLRYFEGRSGGDVAALVGRKLQTVYQALARIHKMLAECVQSQRLSWESDE